MQIKQLKMRQKISRYCCKRIERWCLRQGFSPVFRGLIVISPQFSLIFSKKKKSH